MNAKIYDWTIVGAGPAGIAAAGKLIDAGIEPSNIAWVDPQFRVGDFGTKWRYVSSNTRIELFLRFYQSCLSFQMPRLSHPYAIYDEDPQQTCLLSLAAEPLQWISDHLKQRTQAHYDKVQAIKADSNHWHLLLSNSSIRSKRVILAQGSEPKSLALPNIEAIPLEIALDPQQLAAHCKPNETIAVFGSSHSAILILKTLLEQCRVKQVMNFYQSPLCYAIYREDEILFDNTGLKGVAAQWARTHIDGVMPDTLKRVLSKPDTIASHLAACDKVIYATGFRPRAISIEGVSAQAYNSQNGCIAPGLFGLGIAFPEANVNHLGAVEYQVGLWKFMKYLNQVFDQWLA